MYGMGLPVGCYKTEPEKSEAVGKLQGVGFARRVLQDACAKFCLLSLILQGMGCP